MSLTEQELQLAFNMMVAVANSLNADCSLLHKKKEAGGSWIGVVMVRMRSDASDALEIRVACVGNVDAGKSTLLGKAQLRNT